LAVGTLHRSRAFCPSFHYTRPIQQITLELPAELFAFLSGSGQDLSRAALEAIALEAYREFKLSTGQLRRLLGYHTRMQVHALLKDHGVYLHYDLADLEHDREAGDALPLRPA
jgi:predicted HTH domain antitoxin